jgi:hypothetical protein
VPKVRRHGVRRRRRVARLERFNRKDKMKRLALLVVCLAGLLCFAAPAFAGTTISTVSSWNGSDSFNLWGINATPTYGQTILGNGESLSSWLFVSGDMTAPAGSGFRAVTFNVPGGVTLAAGQEYVLFATTVFSTQSLGFVDTGNQIWGGITTGSNPGVYADGEYVYTNDGNPAHLTTVGWDGNHGYLNGQDVAFSAQFGPAVGATSRVAVCTAQPVQRLDGSQGRFADVEYGFWLAHKDDSGSPYYQSTPAIYVEGFGSMCQISDVVTYGGDPNAFVATGTVVDELGVATSADGSLYAYYAKK